MRVKSVKPLDSYQLEIHFINGLQGVICVDDLLSGPIFQPLKDPAFFNQVFLDEFQVVAWPNGADIDPKSLYQRVIASKSHSTVG